ncbi:DUF1835 domain-containing protein [Pseudomonas sp. TTU2014-080ASC]|uniref:DUF1835 domain-containing protein n=1 Tax=Pseudomonas sp. TTU2014-080ASC TaxID=1729724 RepID=UPI0007189613|nr:DUF1835 domain-containing protein [Pseudomonas sp. TTU2014-080ASC]KRW59058.1 hypothetical protein AO726_16275 [Pseudomonas sp. TTU2014-080ASC]
MWHLVCGDLAAASVMRVLSPAESAGLRVLRDDLAIGPLAGIDQPPCTTRIHFWLNLWHESMQPVPDFANGLAADAKWLAELSQNTQAVTVWTGDSCSEQLLLTRVAHALQGSNVELWEVASANPQRPPRKAVSLRSTDELQAFYQQRALLTTAQRTRLADQWQQVVQGNADIRCWLAGEFSQHTYALVDEPLLQCCREEWRPLSRVMADVLAQTDGFFPTDSFLHWRARELAVAGRIELPEALSAAYSAQQVRLR